MEEYPTTMFWNLPSRLPPWMLERKHSWIAALAGLGLAVHLSMRAMGIGESWLVQSPLWMILFLGGLPLCYELGLQIWKGRFGADFLAGISIVTSVFLGEYLAGAVIVLMLSGGEALESFAVRQASSVLAALAKRMPTLVHRKEDGQLRDIAADQVVIGDLVVIYPHEICPVDGFVVEGHGSMDESFLTGEPYRMSKTPGSEVLSGAINGEAALTIRAQRAVKDSRYAKIMRVMEQSAQSRPQLRRLGDQLGAFYTPLAVAIGLFAWLATQDATRFLAVMVIATPCPLLISIPIAIIGSVSLAAKRAVIIRDPAILEQLSTCRTMIFDKTGTLTYGQPQLEQQLVAEGYGEAEVLSMVTSLERYSKHPLASAVTAAGEAAQVPSCEVASISEPPGQGMRGLVAGREVIITSRHAIAAHWPPLSAELPSRGSGLECIVLIDGRYAATYRFRDTPRPDGAPFIQHLGPRHGIDRILLVSGDRREEVEYLAKVVGVTELHAEKSPEEKLEIVRRETARQPTVYVGDGINDAPALMAATVGLAFGHHSDVTTEAAGAVIMDSSLSKIDELLHIGRRMRSIALQCAIGGMVLSLIGMFIAAFGYLTPVAGAIGQEIIDVLAVLNALRAAFPPRSLTDYRLATAE
jgi:heavy metal translocating P-type ATPase